MRGFGILILLLWFEQMCPYEKQYDTKTYVSLCLRKTHWNLYLTALDVYVIVHYLPCNFLLFIYLKYLICYLSIHLCNCFMYCLCFFSLRASGFIDKSIFFPALPHIQGYRTKITSRSLVTVTTAEQSAFADLEMLPLIVRCKEVSIRVGVRGSSCHTVMWKPNQRT